MATEMDSSWRASSLWIEQSINLNERNPEAKMHKREMWIEERELVMGSVGAMGFGPGPLSSRPCTTKGYSWAGPSNPACEPNLGVQIRISSLNQEGLAFPGCHLLERFYLTSVAG